MDEKTEARSILAQVVGELRNRPYDELVANHLGRPVTRVVRGASGNEYEVQVEAFWDDGRPGPLRVIARVEGDFCRTWKPISEDFVTKKRRFFRR